MSQAVVQTAASAQERKLPRRDWILLPLIAITTVAFLVATCEVVTRIAWSEQEGDACYVPNGPLGRHFLPNCKSKTKVAEGPWVENSYNSCGYRTMEPCGPKPPGTIRIAVLGSSFSAGFLVPYDSIYTTLSGKTLTRACQRHVEYQNLGVPNLPLQFSYYKTEEALALKPNLLLLVIQPYDVRNLKTFHIERGSGEDDKTNQPVMTSRGWLSDAIRESLKSSRASVVLRHFMYRDPTTYLRVALGYGDAGADYMAPSSSPTWQQRYSNLDTMLRLMSEKAKADSVPMAVLVGPTEAQVALVNTPPRAGIDPQDFEETLPALHPSTAS